MQKLIVQIMKYLKKYPDINSFAELSRYYEDKRNQTQQNNYSF